MIMKYTFLPFNISMLRSKCMFCTVGKKKRFQKSLHHASENTQLITMNKITFFHMSQLIYLL